MSRVAIERLQPDAVTMDLTRHLQGMAVFAWAQVLPHRSQDELLNLFNPYDDDHVRRIRGEYQDFADQEGLLVAVPKDGITQMPVGFLLTKEDVSGSQHIQTLKRHFHPGQVYALIQHLVVAPEMQRQGIAKQLAREALSAYRPEQVPTVYVFDEHEFAMRAIGEYGYTITPSDQDPTPVYVFGEDANPAYQYRFAAVDVGIVLERLRTPPESP